MAGLTRFTLKNFKGIEETSIYLEDRAKCPVITLIGLNESGKTTILEGLSHFVSGDRSVSGLFDGVHSKTSGAGLIPVHKKAAFTSDVSITGVVQLDASDLDAIEDIAKSHKLIIDTTELSKPFSVSKTFHFEDSALKRTMNYWSLKLSVRPSRKGASTQFKSYQRPTEKDQPDLWVQLVNLVERALPQVSYFPTSL